MAEGLPMIALSDLVIGFWDGLKAGLFSLVAVALVWALLASYNAVAPQQRRRQKRHETRGGYE